ncbi:hypothetical protein B0H67DRAFT_344288 [Lasiosphaeris hirsuta]|uniref:Uncharacterized protein n=1 Tax=Lasiosphaeris hirsuta TaxID=260670 RepID=A0AA40DMG3_9PEZI|nr:hypothetical protein B0H67DRAFT_344288 [Lasiosphaeris hirsuta]
MPSATLRARIARAKQLPDVAVLHRLCTSQALSLSLSLSLSVCVSARPVDSLSLPSVSVYHIKSRHHTPGDAAYLMSVNIDIHIDGRMRRSPRHLQREFSCQDWAARCQIQHLPLSLAASHLRTLLSVISRSMRHNASPYYFINDNICI